MSSNTSGKVHADAAAGARRSIGGGLKRVLKPIARGILRMLPSGVGATVQTARDYIYDARRFLRHSTSARPPRNEAEASALITKDYHRIEKGLALPRMRPGFGEHSIDYIVSHVPAAEAAYGPTLATRSARAAMKAYVERHRALGFPVPRAESFGNETADAGAAGGVKTVTRAEIEAAARIDFARFAFSRHSVRAFTGAAVAEEDVAEAVAVALKTPCVCNRESRRVHAAFDPEVRASMLSFQNGNRGFGHLAGAVLIVTADLRAFTEAGERNQCWVDGGLFAMTLVYALHARGLGVCMLNWSARAWRDRAMRAAMNIPDNEAVITMMAVGHMPDTFEVAASPRPKPDDILRVIRALPGRRR